MSTDKKHPSTVEEYINGFPNETRPLLEKIYRIVKEEAPTVKEKISYGMPTFVLNGRILVHFAGFKNHIGLYPTPSGITPFEEELQKYKYAKGTIQFQLNEPIPYDFIRKIVAFRVKETKKESEQ